MPYVQYPKPRPTLSRAYADRLLERVVARAREINLDPTRYPYAVRRLVVFGSYLTEKETLGDLDVGVEVVLVRPAHELAEERPRWRPSHWVDRTYAALHVRNPKLVSIHDIGEVINLSTKTRRVFEDRSVRRLPESLWERRQR